MAGNNFQYLSLMSDPEKENNIIWNWKGIGAYLEKDVRTLFRWEKKLGLPIHRNDPDSSKSRVFAYQHELDEWLENRKNDNYVGNNKSSFFRIGWKRISFVLAVSFIALLLVWVAFKNKGPSTLLGKIPSIGFLPYKSLNSSEYDFHLAEGIRNELIRQLSSLNTIRIIPLDSSIDLKSEIENPAFKVDYLLCGNFQYADDMIHLQYKLTSFENNSTIFSDEIHESIDNLNNIKEKISEKIHSKLNIEAGNIDAAREPDHTIYDRDAFALYLKGKSLINLISNNPDDVNTLYYKGKYYSGLNIRESNDLAIEILNQAIALDNSFIPAFIGLARCYLNYANFGWDYNEEWIKKAAELLPTDRITYENYPEYFSVLTGLYLIQYLVFDNNTRDNAFETIKRGIERFPNDPNINILSSYIFFLRYGEDGNPKYFDQALEHAELSFWQEPFTTKNLLYTELLMLKGDFENGLKICRVLRQIDASHMSEYRMGEIYYYSGDIDRSKSVFMLIDNPVNFMMGSLLFQGMIAANQGETANAQRIVARAGHLAVDTLRESQLRLASIHFGLGYEEQGWKHLDEFFKNPSIAKQKHQFARYIELDSNFDTYKDKIRRKYYDGRNQD